MVNRIILLSFFTCVLCQPVGAQTSVLRLYYGINEDQVNPHQFRLDSFIQAIQNQVVEISILGSADFLSNPDYNLKLSQRRAIGVREYLLTKTGPPQVIITSCKGRGAVESKPSQNKAGEAHQRMVEITATWRKPPNKVPDTRPIVLPNPPEKSRDTSNSLKHLSKQEKGKTIRMNGLSFYPGSHKLLPSSKQALEDLLQTLMESPEINIEIQGHICCVTDNSDGYDYDSGDRMLSVNRARTVYQYLIENGISSSRLTYKGYGHTKPLVYPETNAEEEQLNRRVEIMVR